MATPQAPLTPEQRLAAEQQAQYARITRNLAIGGLVLCPIIAVMPPRKLDLYTFSLGVGFYLSADHLCTLRTGRGLISNLNPIKAVDSMPTERAKEMQRMLREEREKSRKAGERTAVEEEGKGVIGLLQKLWMGDEKEGWKERRLMEEKKALEEGKSYTDMILEQIWEVWNWDKKKGGDGEGEGPKKE